MSYSTDSRLLTATAGVRGFGQGFMIIIIVLYLRAINFDPLSIGILLGLSYAGSVLANIFVSIYADRIGRKRTLLLFSCLHFIVPMALLVEQNFLLIAAAFFVGCLSVTGSGSDGFTPVEQAILPQGATRERRNYLFSFYNVSKSLLAALGALFAGLLGTFEVVLHLPALSAFLIFFATYATLGVLLLVLYLRLSPEAELSRPKAEVPPPSGGRWAKENMKEYRIIAKLSALFGLDTFGSGLLTNAIITLWLSLRFDMGAGELGLMFFAGQMIQTISLPVAAKIANRIGLIRMMVVTQVPNNVFAVLMGLSPTLLLAVGFYLAKSLVSTMDTPARQAYTISVVGPEKKVAAGGFTNTSIGAARAVSSATSGYLIQAVESSAPFFLSSAIKLTYDLLLYLSFRHHEQ